MIMQSVLDTAKCWSVEPQATLVCCYIEQLHGLASGGCGQNSEND